MPIYIPVNGTTETIRYPVERNMLGGGSFPDSAPSILPTKSWSASHGTVTVISSDLDKFGPLIIAPTSNNDRPTFVGNIYLREINSTAYTAIPIPPISFELSCNMTGGYVVDIPNVGSYRLYQDVKKSSVSFGDDVFEVTKDAPRLVENLPTFAAYMPNVMSFQSSANLKNMADSVPQPGHIYTFDVEISKEWCCQWSCVFGDEHVTLEDALPVTLSGSPRLELSLGWGGCYLETRGDIPFTDSGAFLKLGTASIDIDAWTLTWDTTDSALSFSESATPRVIASCDGCGGGGDPSSSSQSSSSESTIICLANQQMCSHSGGRGVTSIFIGECRNYAFLLPVNEVITIVDGIPQQASYYSDVEAYAYEESAIGPNGRYFYIGKKSVTAADPVRVFPNTLTLRDTYCFPDTPTVYSELQTSGNINWDTGFVVDAAYDQNVEGTVTVAQRKNDTFQRRYRIDLRKIADNIRCKNDTVMLTNTRHPYVDCGDGGHDTGGYGYMLPEVVDTHTWTSCESCIVTFTWTGALWVSWDGRLSYWTDIPGTVPAGTLVGGDKPTWETRSNPPQDCPNCEDMVEHVPYGPDGHPLILSNATRPKYFNCKEHPSDDANTYFFSAARDQHLTNCIALEMVSHTIKIFKNFRTRDRIYMEDGVGGFYKTATGAAYHDSSDAVAASYESPTKLEYVIVNGTKYYNDCPEVNGSMRAVPPAVNNLDSVKNSNIIDDDDFE